MIDAPSTSKHQYELEPSKREGPDHVDTMFSKVARDKMAKFQNMLQLRTRSALMRLVFSVSEWFLEHTQMDDEIVILRPMRNEAGEVTEQRQTVWKMTVGALFKS